jgi:hypothetical protein
VTACPLAKAATERGAIYVGTTDNATEPDHPAIIAPGNFTVPAPQRIATQKRMYGPMLTPVRRPVIIASQLPVDNWYSAIPSAIIADAIMDRIIHGSYKLQLTGGTLRDPQNRKSSKAPDTVRENSKGEDK